MSIDSNDDTNIKKSARVIRIAFGRREKAPEQKSSMLCIDGQIRAISEHHLRAARIKLEIPSDFNLVEASQTLYHDSANGLIHIPLPDGQVVALLENLQGRRIYAVIKLFDL